MMLLHLHIIYVTNKIYIDFYEKNMYIDCCVITDTGVRGTSFFFLGAKDSKPSCTRQQPRMKLTGENRNFNYVISSAKKLLNPKGLVRAPARQWIENHEE